MSASVNFELIDDFVLERMIIGVLHTCRELLRFVPSFDSSSASRAFVEPILRSVTSESALPPGSRAIYVRSGQAVCSSVELNAMT